MTEEKINRDLVNRVAGLTVTEVALALGTTTDKVNLYRQYGFLPAIRTGHGYRYPQKGIEDFWQKFAGQDLSNLQKIRVAAKTVLKG